MKLAPIWTVLMVALACLFFAWMQPAFEAVAPGAADPWLPSGIVPALSP